jgi:D-3-phosphoglycerate dehydrogenase
MKKQSKDKYRVLITSTSFGRTDPLPLEKLKQYGCEILENPLKRPLKEAELLPLLEDVDGVIAGLDEYTEKVIRTANRLKVISRYGVGLDNVDMDAARANGIRVTTVPGINAEAVADLTIGLMINIARKITQADRSLKKGHWEKIFGHSVFGKTLGIIGYGRIGQAVRDRVRGFQMTILVHDPDKEKELNEMDGVEYRPLEGLLRESDFISMHANLSEESRFMIGYDELSIMKPDSYLINTARGGLINEDDLYRALEEGLIAGAALDCYLNEPPTESPLLSLDNVLTTPHIGSYSYESVLEMGLCSVDNLINAFEGK